MKKILTALLAFATLTLSANAQQDTTRKASLPDTTRTAIEEKGGAINFTKGTGAAIDTLDIGDGRVQVVICDDNTWYYIRNLSILEKDDVFTAKWDNEKINP